MQLCGSSRSHRPPAVARLKGRFGQAGLPVHDSRVLRIDEDGAERLRAEAFVRAVFLRQHRARVGTVAPHLLACESGGRLRAVVGWRGGAEGGFFLENYLDQPVEEVLSSAMGLRVPRGDIAEVANLAAASQGAGAWLMRDLGQELAQRGFDWAVFTATLAVQNLLSRVGLGSWRLVDADARRVGVAARDWGDYYANQPVVMACRVAQWVALAEPYA